MRFGGDRGIGISIFGAFRALGSHFFRFLGL